MNNIFVEFLPPWVESGLQPAFYDKESGSVLQQTARMYSRVNMLIRMFNKLSKQTKYIIEEYINKFNELHDYAMDYFDNLDVQEEINNKLDAMAEAGTLQEIIGEYLGTQVIMCFDTVDDMKKALNIIDGSFTKTIGFYSKNDGGGALYFVREKNENETANNITTFASVEYNNLIFEIVLTSDMSVKQFGCYGDGTHEESTLINSVLSIMSGNTIRFPSGTYLLDNSISVPGDTIIIGDGSSTVFKAKDAINVNDNLIKLEGSNKTEIHSISIDGNRSNQDEAEYTQYGLMVSGCENVVVDSVLTSNINGVGIQVYNSRYTTIRSSEGAYCRYHAFECEQCQDCSFTSCFGHDNDRHGIFISPGEVGGTGSLNNTISNCVFNNNSEYGVAFGIDAQGLSIGLTRNNIVSNCVIHNNTYYGVSIYKVDRVTVANCDINGNGAFGIYIYQSKECAIIGNRLQDDSSSSSGSYDEINIEGYADGTASLHNLISNNIIQPSNARYAIQEANAGDGPNVIVNNYVYSNGITGKYNIQNTDTYYDISDVEFSKIDSSIRKFKGLVVTDSTLPSGMGIDSPFANVLRIVNNDGNTQISNANPASSVDFYIDGNSEFTVSASDVNLQGNNLTNYIDLGGWIVSPPNSPSASGIAGMRAYDTDYLYICVATDTWKRIAFGAWS